MKETVIAVPAMYGDHHVLEVRRILFDLPGVVEVKASSCFQTVQVNYDSSRLDVAQITARLAQAGYLEPLPMPAESERGDSPLVELGHEVALRHTVAYAQTKQTIGFAQEIHPQNRPLWPCPGFGVITQKELSDG